MHPEPPDTPARLLRADHLPATLGALLGVAMLWGVSLAHPASHRIANELAMGTTFSQLALRLAPALLASLVAEVLLTVSGLRHLDSWLGRRTPPLLVVFAFACSIVLLGVAPSVVYLLGAVLMSESVTWLQSHGDVPRAQPYASLTERTWKGLRSALFATDHVLPWMLLGLGAGAFVESSVAPGALALSPSIAVPLAALLGWPLRLYPVGLVPLLAVLVHKGLPPGAALAFLLTSPLCTGPLHRFHWRSSWRLVLVTFLIPMGAGLVLSWLPGVIRPSTLHEDALAPATSVEIVSLAVLALLALGSLLRCGPRAWVEQIVGEDDHGHTH